MSESEHKRSVSKIAVEVELLDGTTLFCTFFLRPNQRLSDLLNDERAFLPVETSENTIFLQKLSVRRVTLLEQDRRYEGNDPYRLLGVPENIGDEELKSAYRRVIREGHPDRVQAAGLPEEFIEFAGKRLARINDAYQRILKRRAAKPNPD